MRYLIKFIVETDAPRDAVKEHFDQMGRENVSHEIVDEDADRAWDADISDVEVTSL